VVGIEESTLEDTFERLLDEAVELCPGLDRDRVLDDLLRREQAMTSYVGHGVAIAHAYSEQGERSICVAGHLEPPLTEEGYPEEIRLIFLLVSPSGQADLHLAALGRLARVASEAEVVSAIVGSESLSQTLSLLRAWERHTET
jgi:PTS system fructose-specific IIA component